MKKLNILL